MAYSRITGSLTNRKSGCRFALTATFLILNQGGGMRFTFMLSLAVLLMTSIPAFADYYQYTDKDGVMHFTDELSEVPTAQQPSVTTHQSVDKESDTTAENQNQAPEEEMQVEGEDQGYAGDQNEAPDTMVQQQPSSEPETAEGEPEVEEQSPEDQDQVAGETGEPETQEMVEEQPSEDQAAPEDQTEQASGGQSWRTKAREKQKEIDSKRSDLDQRYKTIQDEKARLGTPPPEDAPPAEKNAYYERSNKVNEQIVKYQEDYMSLEKEVETFNQQAMKKIKK
jgi:hypothetical protein